MTAISSPQKITRGNQTAFLVYQLCYERVQELRGNIRVYVRVKPLTEDEIASGITPVLRCTAEGSRIECLSANSTKAFDFDHVFSPKSTQSQVFGEVAGLITSVLDGCALAMHDSR